MAELNMILAASGQRFTMTRRASSRKTSRHLTNSVDSLTLQNYFESGLGTWYHVFVLCVESVPDVSESASI
jgi:hypothetical protein